MRSGLARGVAIAVALACVGVVAYLAWGSLRSSDSDAVGDLPTVAEIVAAQAHKHGVTPLTEQEIVELDAPPTDASTLSPFDQVRVQLEAVKAAAGLDEALAILTDVVQQSPVVASDCEALYVALAADAAGARPLAQVCPG